MASTGVDRFEQAWHIMQLVDNFCEEKENNRRILNASRVTQIKGYFNDLFKLFSELWLAFTEVKTTADALEERCRHNDDYLIKIKKFITQDTKPVFAKICDDSLTSFASKFDDAFKNVPTTVINTVKDINLTAIKSVVDEIKSARHPDEAGLQPFAADFTSTKHSYAQSTSMGLAKVTRSQIDKIKEIIASKEPKLSDADLLKKKEENRLSTIVTKPTGNCNVDPIEIKKKLNNKINCRDMNVFIKKIHPTIQKNLIIKVDSEESAGKLINSVRKCANRKKLITADRPKPQLTKLILTRVPNSFDEKKILDILAKNLNCNINLLNIKKLNQFESTFFTYLLTFPEVYGRTLLDKQKIMFFFHTVYIKKFIRILRCFNCQCYGHLPAIVMPSAVLVPALTSLEAVHRNHLVVSTVSF